MVSYDSKMLNESRFDRQRMSNGIGAIFVKKEAGVEEVHGLYINGGRFTDYLSS